MMKFFQNFRHEELQNVIKRTPPPRFIKILKNTLKPEEHYAHVFDQSKNNFMPFIGKGISTANSDYSALLRPFKLAFQTMSHSEPKDHIPQKKITHRTPLHLKKIDPRIVASALATEPKISNKILINLINHLHFNDENVAIHIQNIETKEEFFLQGKSGPYFNDRVTIQFTDPEAFDLQRHRPLNVVIDNRKSLIVFPVVLLSGTVKSITLSVPGKAYSYSKRQTVRYPCNGIDAEILQGQLYMHGVLEDINPQDLRIRMEVPEDINAANPLLIKLNRNNQIYFMGECQMMRSDKHGSSVIVQPIHNNRPVLKPRKYPNPRVKIMPQPVIHFTHPLCGQIVQYKVEDISASGFSVTIPFNESLLIPGMVIPQTALQLPGMLDHLTCTVQVVYRRKQKKDMARYGFYILDMSLHDHRLLFDAVSKVADPHVNMAGKINMDSLWDLFFDSGFIYPDKYGIISPYTTALKETYRRLYEDGKDIFTHLTYQDQGQIYGHLSMVKAYEKSWIIHHLAARPLRGVRTGLKTLNHFVNYIDCVYRLPVSSKNMRYNFCYFRPENKFSDYYFGGIYRTLKNREMCSMDLFGYMSIPVDAHVNTLPDGWSVERFTRDDLTIMRGFYNGFGGGMMPDAFALEYRTVVNGGLSNVPAPSDQNDIMEMYRKAGLNRDSRVFSIIQDGILKAVMIVDTSDLGINMSELINSIKVIIIDKTLPWPILHDALSIAGKVYNASTIIALFFPFNYLAQQGIDCKKKYNLWVINTNLESFDKDVVKEHIRIAKRKFITESFVKELSKNRLERWMRRSKNEQ
ncbi:MAG: PilZ domain-containing protein [Smithella sp.]|nr:PilZ domain-containing protein [Smithella sp.]MDM7985856.1 PilZ domain-containing protein [Smithella sp.]HOU50575.1 PilZ domain-containing protein [Smithella sp.]HQG65621.1 PilZ domain-containing protein [Smithella sp.]HQI72224.1 PilZ domain-containing protein [Smithella sp.]